tara:strand:+ start:41641 stop:41880 length:240 start_codon:yes stop_codon:yes gene_type:complete
MITIYGKNKCPFCVKAKNLCQEKGIEFKYKEVGVDLTKEQLFGILGEEVRTVPQIVSNEGDGFMTKIGGYNQLVEYLNQ